MLSTVFGNISASGMLKWIDVAFPKKYLEAFQGPKFGVEGMRKCLGVYDRPLVNAMIKPNIGWTPDEGAEIFYHAAKGGVDVIKDDELMPADADFCPLEERVKKFMAMEKRAFFTDISGSETMSPRYSRKHINGWTQRNILRSAQQDRLRQAETMHT